MKRFLIVLLLFVFLLAGCGATTDMSTEYAGDQAAETKAAPATAAAESAVQTAAPETSVSIDEAGLGEVPNANLPDTNRKLVYTSSFGIETRNFEKDYQKIISNLNAQNGYIENEKTEGTAPSDLSDKGRHTTFKLRIPIENYNAFVDSLNGIGTLQYKKLKTDDVSSKYYDTESRIELLEARHERLLGYLKNATKTEDVIQLEKEISDVLYELDSLNGYKKQLNELIEYATVSIELTETVNTGAIQSTDKEENFGTRANDAFMNSVDGVWTFLQGFAVFWIGAFPVLVLIAIPVLIALLIVLLVRRHRKKPSKS